MRCALWWWLVVAAAAQNKRKDQAPRLLVSLEDGVVLTLDAWTGLEIGRFASGGSLMMPHVNPQIPIYDAVFSEVPLMQCRAEVIEVITDQFLEHEREKTIDTKCGLLYGERLRKVIAVDVTSGHLLWEQDGGVQRHSADTQLSKHVSSSVRPALLQKEEFVVRMVDASEGFEHWNVTWSTITAFGPPTEDDGDLGENKDLPRIEWMWPKKLRAFDGDDILWSLSIHEVPTGVFAATRDGVWTKVIVDVVDAPPSQQLTWATSGILDHRDMKPMLPAPGLEVRPDNALENRRQSIKLELSPKLLVQLILALVGVVVSTVWVVLRHDRKRRASLPLLVGGSSPSYEGVVKPPAVPPPAFFLDDDDRRPVSTRSLGSMLDRLVPRSSFRHNKAAATSESTTTKPSTNSLVSANRYEAEFEQKERLGDGGFGTVHRAVNRLDAKEYAIKKIQIRSGKLRDKILREVKILAGLDHPNIVRYYQAWLEQVDDFPVETKAEASRELSTMSSGTFLKTDEDKEDDDDDDDECVDWTDDEDDCGVSFRREEENEEEDDDPEWAALPVANDSSQLQSQRPSRRKKPGPNGASSLQLNEDTTTLGGAATTEKKHRRRRRRRQRSVSEEEEDTESPSECLLLYIQMQLCSAQTLREHLDRRPAGQALEVDAALNIFAQACRGLKYVHARDLIHRDLKPANIFLNTDGGVKIGDFGLSRVAKHREDDDVDDSSDVDEMTPRTHFDPDVTAGVGTRLYAAPEQLSSDDYDEQVDIYSLGVVLFEMLRPKFDTAMERYVVLGSLPDTAPADLLIDPSHPPDLTALVSAMLRKDPTSRPSASAANDTVDTILDRGLVQALHLENPSLTKVVLRSADGDLRIYNSDGVVLSESHSGDSTNTAPPDRTSKGSSSW